MDIFQFFNTNLAYVTPTDHLPAYPPDCVIGERAIEVPIARLFLSRFPAQSVMEVGAVMPYWNSQIDHHVIDIADPWKFCILADCDAVDNYRNFNVLCISTLEHVGTTEHKTQDGNRCIINLSITEPDKSVRCFEKMVQAANYLISIPLGYNSVLDQHVKRTTYNRFMYKQVEFNKWERLQQEEWDIPYNHPFPWGNVVVFITNVDLTI